MKITKFEHSGFLIEKDGRGVLIDPVELTKKLPEFSDIDALIITHSHGDHFQPEVLERIRSANPDAVVFVTEDNLANIEGAEIVRSGDSRNAGAFSLEFFGKDHAEIVDGEVPCQNIGVMIDSTFATPGDSFDKPPADVEILAVPITAPWLKIRESMDYIRTVKPKIVAPTHDGLNSDFGNTVCDNWIRKGCEEVKVGYCDIHYGEIKTS
jgi:L-ascorbate metabolism protein UlaG (beta-lactamase superfamily)